MKQKICAAIDACREEIIRIGDQILAHPELGYKEFQTSALVQEELEKLGLSCKTGLARTGVKATIGDPDAPINICIIGEMDAVKCYGHPAADPQTGAAHACGHNAQIASLLGAAMGLIKSGVLAELPGRVTFFAVPAEEFVELDFREQLKQKGEIEFFGGKQELLRLGEFDDIDIAMMVHSQAGSLTPELYLGGSSLGFTAKQITFRGKAAHGSTPFDGVNALNAAMVALMGIHANREPFRDEDRIRIHPIITSGGELVNVVPSVVTMETYVRGARGEAIEDACRNVDAAVQAGALAIGAQCEILDTVGYLPLHQDAGVSEIFEENARALIGGAEIHHGIDMVGSTDIGDLSQKIPCIQPTMGGFAGTAHGADFAICDKNAAYLLPAKIMACTVVDLLRDGMRKALDIKQNFHR